MRYIYQNVVQDQQGKPVTDATVTVYLAGTSNLATIYTAFSGGTADADSAVSTDANGLFFFYVDTDDYLPSQSFKFTITKSTFGSETWDYIKIIPVDTVTAREWTGQQNFAEKTITSTSNSVAWNLDTAQCAVHTLTENTTIAAPTNMNAGGTYILRVIQAAGVYTLAWNAVFKFGEQSAPSAPAANGDYIVCSFYSDGTNMIYFGTARVEA